MARTLEIIEIEDWQLGKVWAMLGEIAGLYGDNGGDPDGNVWFPSVSVITEAEAGKVIKAGFGRMTKVLILDDEEIAGQLGIEDVLDLALCCEDWEAMKNAVDDRVAGWAHYNAYGTGDSVWVMERKE